VKKILIFCLYCVVFTLIPAASIMAGGGKEKKPFPAAQKPPEEGDTYYVSETDPADDEDFFIISETDDFKKGETSYVPEITTASKVRSASAAPETPVVNKDTPAPAPVPETPVVNPVVNNDRGMRSGAENSSAATAAAEFAAAAAQSAAAAAQSAQAAESAAATVTAAQPPPPPPAQQAPYPYQQPPQPVPSRVPPPQPMRTVVPTVNIILPPIVPPAASPAVPPAAQPAAPPVYQPTFNVIPRMPDPYSDGVYRVQLGSFSNAGLAQQCFNRLKSADFTPYYEQYGSLYRVVITGIQAADMAAVVRRLEAAGFTEAWVREER
jgi:hypothetical protein